MVYSFESVGKGYQCSVQEDSRLKIPDGLIFFLFPYFEYGKRQKNKLAFGLKMFYI